MKTLNRSPHFGRLGLRRVSGVTGHILLSWCQLAFFGEGFPALRGFNSFTGTLFMFFRSAIKKIFAVFFLVVFSFFFPILFSQSSNSEKREVKKTEDQPSVSDWKKKITPESIFYYSNLERSENNIKTLSMSGVLEKAAQKKAEDMAQRRYFSHIGPDDKEPWKWIQEENYAYLMAGENLAVSFNYPSSVVEAWMDSPSHKDNLLNSDFGEMGIGIAEGMYKNKKSLYVVQFFAKPN